MNLNDPTENERCNAMTLHDTYDSPYIGWCLSCGGIASEVYRPGFGWRSRCCYGIVLETDPLCKKCGKLDERNEDRLCPDCQEDENEEPHPESFGLDR